MTDTDTTAQAQPGEAQGSSSRRALLRGAALMGVGVPVLAACGGSDDTSGDADPTTPEASSSDGGGGGGAAESIATTSEVPEGGGLILEDAEVVITQPAAGEFKGFSSICTHQGCPVDNVSDGTINCICHGSKFSIEDGSVANGPATAPLPEKQISVKGDAISLA